MNQLNPSMSSILGSMNEMNHEIRTSIEVEVNLRCIEVVMKWSLQAGSYK